MQDINNPSVQIAATTTSARVALPLSTLNGVEIVNLGTSPVFVQSGDSTVVASATTSRVVHPNWPRIFKLNNTQNTHVAAVTATGTATVVITPCGGDETA